MKRPLFSIFSIVFFSLFFAGFSENKYATIDAAINQFAGIDSHSYQKKTTTGSFSVADTSGAIDYVKQKAWAKTTADDQLIEKIYSKNKKVYIYNGITDQWFQLNFNDYYFDPGFNKNKIFLFFNRAAQSNGFELQDSNTENKDFFVLKSKIKSRKEARKYILDNLEIIFGENFSQKLKRDINLLNDYLSCYMDNFTTIAWIRKKDFFLIKKRQAYRQPVGPGRSVRIEEDTTYYDFNEKVEVKIPKIAEQSPTINNFIQ